MSNVKKNAKTKETKIVPKPATNLGIEFNKVKPKTKNQATFMDTIRQNHVTICHGPAGTGKTLCALSLACEYLLNGLAEKILISRTIIACGDLGALPGDEGEKSAPYFIPYFDYLEKILGSQYKKYLNKDILLRPLELLRGHTYHRTIMICDEAQNVTGKQLKLFISRMGDNSKCIILGDESQSDTDACGFRFSLNYLENIEGVGISKLGYEDVLRSPILAPILRVFDTNGY